MPRRAKLRLALTCWEPGRVQTGFGAKTGGLGVVMEELPEELIGAAAAQDISLEIEVLTPCFGHYDRSRLKKLALTVPVVLDGQTFEFEIYRLRLSQNLSLVYFWDDWQLNWTNSNAIYPDDPEMAFRLFATVSQAMAGYIRQGDFHTVHGHDYHVALVPFYLGDEYLEFVPHHLTVHNATYQGVYPVRGKGYEMLERINLPGELLFHRYFDFFDNLNFLKAGILKTHETGGKITTVSGDLVATWGYAAELREDVQRLQERARSLSRFGTVGEIFLPNRHLDVFEKIPIVGISNGLSNKNRPENLPELQAEYLQRLQAGLKKGETLFQNPEVQRRMLDGLPFFDKDNLNSKKEFKKLLHREAFGVEPSDDTILLTAVGRLVEQKNLSLVVDIAERVLAYDSRTAFVVLAAPPNGDGAGMSTEAGFRALSSRFPDRFYFKSGFNLPLSKLILAGGDFSLIPSRFEPCGLVDYEASLLGNIVIGHRTGGLAKVQECSYLYDWLDLADRAGEAQAFYQQIQQAIDTYRNRPGEHLALVRSAMSLNASWSTSAAQYVSMYRYGTLLQVWKKKRETWLEAVDTVARKLAEKEPLFFLFFTPATADVLDLRLAKALRKLAIKS